MNVYELVFTVTADRWTVRYGQCTKRNNLCTDRYTLCHSMMINSLVARFIGGGGRISNSPKCLQGEVTRRFQRQTRMICRNDAATLNSAELSTRN